MRKAFDKIDEFLKSNPFNLQQPVAPDSDALFNVEDKPEESAHLDEIEKPTTSALSDDDIDRIARRMVELQNKTGGDVE